MRLHARAIAFAKALDQNQLAAAEQMLAEHCVYEAPDGIHRGRAAIIAAYGKSADWGEANLDEVRYESSVDPQSERGFRIHFVDHIRKGPHEHTHRCAQVVTLDDEGKIVRIVHEHIAGEPEALKAFWDQAGLVRD